MQVDFIDKLPSADRKHTLRVATNADTQADLNFFYIGSDNKSIKCLSELFKSGYITSDFDAARKFVKSADFNSDVDVIILDVPYDQIKLKVLQVFLKTGRVLPTTPIIYNIHQLKDPIKTLEKDNIVDDIIDLHNCEFNISTKIALLKKAKELGYQAQQPENIKTSISFFKRLFDIVISAIILFLTLPLFILIAIAIKLESRGPVFYNAKRAGRGFNIFDFYKFRTMEMNADKKIDMLAHLNQYDSNAKGPKFFKITNDPRITKVGKVLRNTSLDELPQLINVIKGDMSLVGNRPLPLYEASTLTTNEFVERFMAPAGMTGLWQIKKRGQTEMSVEERIHLDISYARKFSLLYDLWIIARTPRALLQKTDV